MNEDIIGQLDEDTRKRIAEGGMQPEEYEALGLDWMGKLDEDTRKKLLNGEITQDELMAMGLIGDDDFLAEEFGEDELDE